MKLDPVKQNGQLWISFVNLIHRPTYYLSLIQVSDTKVRCFNLSDYLFAETLTKFDHWSKRNLLLGNHQFRCDVILKNSLLATHNLDPSGAAKSPRPVKAYRIVSKSYWPSRLGILSTVLDSWLSSLDAIVLTTFFLFKPKADDSS